MPLLCLFCLPAVGIHVLGVEVNSMIPLDAVEGHTGGLEDLHIGNSAEDTETQVGLHVEDSLLTVFELDGECEVIVWEYLGH